jgi:hypothetical protein
VQEMQPDNSPARFHFGRNCANQGRYSQPIERLERASTTNDGSAPIYLYSLGAAQARAGKMSAAWRLSEPLEIKPFEKDKRLSHRQSIGTSRN